MVKKDLIPKILQGFKVEPPKPKIYQYQGQRYAIRLEPVFLRTIDSLAREWGIKSNALIASLKTLHKGKNFSSFIRSFCMAEAEKKLSGLDAMDSFDNLRFFMENCPIPGLLLTEERVITFANQAFFSWVDTPDLAIREKEFHTLFDIRDNQSIRELLNRLIYGVQKQASLSITYSGKTPALSATASFIPYTNQQTDRYHFIVWIKTAPTKRPPRIFKLEKPQN